MKTAPRREDIMQNQADETTRPAGRVDTPWMTIHQVALYLSVSPGTVRNWVSQRRVPFARRGRVVRFHRNRIDRWLDSASSLERRRMKRSKGAANEVKPPPLADP